MIVDNELLLHEETGNNRTHTYYHPPSPLHPSTPHPSPGPPPLHPSPHGHAGLWCPLWWWPPSREARLPPWWAEWPGCKTSELAGSTPTQNRDYNSESWAPSGVNYCATMPKYILLQILREKVFSCGQNWSIYHLQKCGEEAYPSAIPICMCHHDYLWRCEYPTTHS